MRINANLFLVVSFYRGERRERGDMAMVDGGVACGEMMKSEG